MMRVCEQRIVFEQSGAERVAKIRMNLHGLILSGTSTVTVPCPEGTSVDHAIKVARAVFAQELEECARASRGTEPPEQNVVREAASIHAATRTERTTLTKEGS